ncbi:response regulator [Enterovirga rhinocerotis]|uniref:Two-component system phosphate regulon response regulator OmpR n=1 Tax=Enterovirga rhinocerotis TaxID=1339210 RepID=A0A4R7C425_9HYPH|nr:response regulator transcription factor [Enterovirga rhinocerotis]TDR93214.1 two-component system phosphate regulon response regulator OmpR [Enterovirga rhinocerotis]
MTSPRTDPPDDAPHILVVDDDRRLRELLSRFLRERGYRVTTAASAPDARAKSRNVVFDAIVLDVMMPGESGVEFLRGRRAEGCALPVLMLTAQAEPEDRIKGLETGADDYLTKPFDPRELILRLGNILKRAPQAEAETKPLPATIRFGPFTFRFDRGELARGGEVIRITDREREILALLGQRGGGEVSREELSGGAGGGPNERAVDVQMNRLRRKIELDPANPAFLQTVRGVGYRLVIDA